MKKSLLAIGVAIAAIVAGTENASANYNAPHKYTDSTSGKSFVVIPNQTPNSTIANFLVPRPTVQRTLTLNNCGWGSLTKGSSAPTNITGTSTFVNWNNKTTGTAVTCTKDPSPATTYTSNNNGPLGTVIDDGSKIWIKGGATTGSIIVNVETSSAITTKTNACGFVQIATSASRPFTNFNIGSTNYTFSTLPSVSKPMICKKFGTESTAYIPK